MFFERTTESIVLNSLDKLSKYTNFSQLTPGSKARAFLDIFSDEQGIQHSIFDENLMQTFIRYADDKFLSFFGDIKNLPRLESSFASASNSDNFYFYVTSGTFGDINSSSDFTIPKGTIVSTVAIDSALVTPGLSEQEVISYVTTDNVLCSADASIVYCPIRAVIEGSSSNIPRNVLNQHDFSAYSLSSSNRLKCTNKYSIANGEERESTEAYRYRLLNIDNAREGAIPIALRLAALSTRGVSDIVEVPCEQGCGSYTIYVQALAPTPSQRLLTEVSQACSLVATHGSRIFVLAPTPIGVELICTVNWKPNTTLANISEGYRVARLAIENRLNKTKIGESIDLSELVDLIVSSSVYIKSVGYISPNKFEETYVFRKDPLTDGVSRNLFTNQIIEPLYNERIILETSTKSRGISFITKQQ